MSLRASSWAVRNPIPIIIIFALFLLSGWYSFVKLPINNDPEVSLPIISVSISQAGASPVELENSITRRVEAAVSKVPGVRHINSTIQNGISETTVEFNIEINPDRALNDIRDSITLIRADLPSDIVEPTISRIEANDTELFYFAVNSTERSLLDLSWFIDDNLTSTMLAVPGVQKIERFGGVDREIRVEFLPEKMHAYGLSIAQINQQLANNNLNAPAGQTRLYARELMIRVLASSYTVQELTQRRFALADGGWVRLTDIAKISDGNAERRSVARLNGSESVGFSVTRTKGASDITVANNVLKAVANLQEIYPDLSILPIISPVDYTYQSYKESMFTLLEGALLTVLVVFVFLRNWRATLVAAITLPLSIMPTFAVMLLAGHTLNSITLLALTLVIGILVDDAIVEIENIERHLERGQRPYQAAIDAADAIGFAVVAITLSIVAVFLPVSFMGGIIGRYFNQFGVTVSVAVLVSLLTARLVTPLLAAYLLKPKPIQHPKAADRETSAPRLHNNQGWLLTRYMRLLNWTLQHRFITTLIALAFLIGSFSLAPLLPTGFLPSSDISLSQLRASPPPGTPLSITDERISEVAKQIQQRPEVEAVFTSARADSGNILIRLKPTDQRKLSQREFEQDLLAQLQHFADIRLSFGGGFSAQEFSLTLVSDDYPALLRSAYQLRQELQGVKGLSNVRVNEPMQRPELQVEVRQEEATQLGVSASSIAHALRNATMGPLDSEKAKFNLNDRQIPIHIALPEEARNNIDILRRLPIPTANGTSVPLHAVAKFSFGNSPAKVERVDRKRRIIVSANMSSAMTLGAAMQASAKLPTMQKLPPNITQVKEGNLEAMGEMFESFGTAMLFGLVLVLAVLIVLFGDFLQPFTILSALPLSLGGAFGALLLFNKTLDMAAVIGILMLMGIVTKNSILLVEFIIVKRKHGLTRHQALIQSGIERARPIIMTTLAMGCGMLPAALSTGASAGFRSAMAITVIGGLITSTLLSLVFVPMLYSLVDDVGFWLKTKLARLSSVTQADKDEAERLHMLETSNFHTKQDARNELL